MTLAHATVEELRKLAEAATPGPWKAAEWQDANGGGWAAIGPLHAADGDDDGPGSTAHQCAEADAALIAAMRSALPALLDRLERAEEKAEAGSKLWSYVQACLASDADFRPTSDERQTLERLGQRVEVRLCALQETLPSENDDAGPMESCGECASTLCDGDCTNFDRAVLDDEALR